MQKQASSTPFHKMKHPILINSLISTFTLTFQHPINTRPPLTASLSLELFQSRLESSGTQPMLYHKPKLSYAIKHL
ncbi:hypothetical protein [Saccharicrinis fermentans]|uniref:Uncharacterized protein n=1 Tax=Saccharicrinis fermentans DSM 9555 = JCM 21142 TaxID=869213 RepID=W7Y0F4_9BACT|nr:hypothetical protein [Saccharicrinis fermentans]GAF04395.1 hypothetical protein JCM21142_83098 [Saccharicrinis fermentans DSM 9555 = JCM 21142]